MEYFHIFGIITEYMLDNNLSRNLVIWAEAGTRDTAFELPSKNTAGRRRLSAGLKSKRGRAALLHKGEQLSLFK